MTPHGKVSWNVVPTGLDKLPYYWEVFAHSDDMVVKVDGGYIDTQEAAESAIITLVTRLIRGRG